MRYLIIGNSAAGLAAGKAIRQQDGKASIILFSDEPYPYYSRLLITYLLRGEISEKSLFQGARKLYHEYGLQVKIETRITEILPAENRVLTFGKKSFSYDRLLIATGSIPVTLKIPGIKLPGVFPVRTLEHAKKIRQRMKPGGKAVILGGGLVGMQTAQALHRRRIEPILVVSSDRLLSRNFDSQVPSFFTMPWKKPESKFSSGGSRRKLPKGGRENCGWFWMEGKKYQEIW